MRTFAIGVLESTLQDVRYALRTLRRSPGFTATALVTLALTTGAVSAVLSLYNTMMLRPMAGERPQELVVVNPHRIDPKRGQHEWGRVSYLDYLHVRDRATTLRDLAAHCSGGSPAWVSHGGHAREMSHAYVSANFFSVLGLRPALGRFFSTHENEVPGRDYVVVLSHRLWEEWGKPVDILGAAVKIGGRAYTVIGVTPVAFTGLDPQRVEFYIPALLMGTHVRTPCNMLTDPGCVANFHMIGRRRQERTVEEVNAEVATLSPPRWQEQAEPDSPAMVLAAHGPRGAYGIYGQFSFERSSGVGRPLAFVAGLCLLLGCANLAGLLLARGSSRGRELAIRPSLGATPLRLVRQLLTESLLVAVAGGALGVLLSMALTRALHAMYMEWDGGRFQSFDLSPDVVVLAWTAAVSVLAGFLFGLLPAMSAVRLGARLSLSRSATAAAPSSRLSRWLIGAQVAAALALLAQVAILWSGSRRFVTDGHFDPNGVALVRVSPGSLKYAPEKAQSLHQEALRRIAALPGVLRVSATSDAVTLIGGYDGYRDAGVKFARPPVPTGGSRETRGRWTAVTPGHFALLGTPLLHGRDFDARDTPESPRVAIVNETLARRLWPAGNAVGSTLMVSQDPPAEVIGVIADVAAPAWGQPRDPHAYVHFQQARTVNARYCVKVAGNPAAILPQLVRTLHELDPEVPLKDAMTLATHLNRDQLKEVQMVAWIASYGAAIALLLCAVGIYGTLAFAVTRRTKEIGLRVAVGASPGDILGLIVHEEMRVVLAAVVVGVGLAWGASRFIRHLIYGVPSTDVGLYAGAAAVVVAVGLLACWLPARRAARLDPMTALKAE
jgi:predicted permease